MSVAVIGDVILDIYKYGITKRISPEAPVPIVTNIETKYVAGGAANVAANLASLGVNTALYGACGSDQEQSELRRVLASAKLKDHRVLAFANKQTITKTRIISDNQHMLRLDHDCDFSDTDACERNLISHRDYDAIIISDYNKGTVSNPRKLIEHIRCPIYVDPKKSFDNYYGAWLIKPNEKEFRQFVGDFVDINHLVALARESLETNNINNMLVTLGKDGMVLINKYEHHIINSSAQQVCDVTGAGDTAMASFVYEFNRTGSLIDAANLANHMAGIAVSKIGNYIANINDIATYNKKKIVFTNGCFDILHVGHIEYLKKSKELGDYLIVGLNSDNSVREIKGPDRPINNQEARKKVLEALSFVDKVIIFDNPSSYDLIKSIKPDVITKGGDYTFDTVVGNDLAEVVVIPFVEGYSTTSIINKL